MDPTISSRVIVSLHLTEAGEPYDVQRSWKERLFSRPWRPLKATRTVTPQVPRKGALQLADGTLVVHPAILKRLMADRKTP